MEIAILGAGRVGGTLGRRLAALGHTVHYALRDPAAPIPDELRHERATTGAAAEVVARSALVLLCTPWAAVEEALGAVPDFGGRPLFDVTNPIGPGLTLTHGHGDSGAEQVQRWAPSARVVKVFNQTGVETMADPRFPQGSALMLACGDDEAAVGLAVELARQLGFDAHPFGRLSAARLLEPLALVWIRLAMVHGHGRGVALGLLRR